MEFILPYITHIHIVIEVIVVLVIGYIIYSLYSRVTRLEHYFVAPEAPKGGSIIPQQPQYIPPSQPVPQVQPNVKKVQPKVVLAPLAVPQAAEVSDNEYDSDELEIELKKELSD